MTIISPTPLQIPAKDGFLLDAELYASNQAESKGLIIIHEGTALPKKLYQPYARFLASQGFEVVCYDYRGIGKSRPKSLKGFSASIIDWAQQDMVGVIDWAQQHYPKLPKYILAHSMGGQIVGLVENIDAIDKIVTVASSYGNWHNFSGNFKYQAAFLWGVLIPIFTRLYGYLPAQQLGMGADWPKGVAQNWYDWCKGNKPHSQLMDEASIPHYYRTFKVPIKAFIMADDFMATTKTIPLFETDYAHTQLDVEIVEPQAYGLAKIGHFGFFSQQNKEALWQKPIDFFMG